MKPADYRREAYRLLRDANASMRRSVQEAERLLLLADGHGAEEVTMRRSIEELALLEPEMFVGARLQ